MNNALVTRFAAVYAGLGLFLLLAGFSAYMSYTIKTVKSPATVVHISDLGITEEGKAAMVGLAQSAQSQGVVVISQKVTKITQDPKEPNTKYVYVSMKTNQGPIKVKVTMNKGIWTFGAAERVG